MVVACQNRAMELRLRPSGERRFTQGIS